MSLVKDLMKKSEGKFFPGTSMKFKKSSDGPKVSSVKKPSFSAGSKLNLK